MIARTCALLILLPKKKLISTIVLTISATFVHAILYARNKVLFCELGSWFTHSKGSCTLSSYYRTLIGCVLHKLWTNIAFNSFHEKDPFIAESEANSFTTLEGSTYSPTSGPFLLNAFRTVILCRRSPVCPGKYPLCFQYCTLIVLTLLLLSFH